MPKKGGTSAIPIRSLMISSSYPQNSRDWKSVFIKQLMEQLSQFNDIELSYWGPPGELCDKIKYVCSQDESNWLEKIMRKGGIIHLIRKGGSGLLSPIRYLYLLRKAYKRNLSDLDVIHVNWLQNAIPLIGMRTPAVISVLGSDYGMLRIPGMVQLLRISLRNKKCVIAPNAEWMVESLNNKFGDLSDVVLVPFGIDEGWYEVERETDRSEPFQWLVVSRLTSKKIGTLFDWGKNIFQNNSRHQLHLFGPMQEEMKLPSWLTYHGPTHPEELKKVWFPKVSGLISLSDHDEGRPQVMLEAMASGIPVVASSIPAHQSLISHKETGWLVSSEADFELSLAWLSKRENNEIVSKNAKQFVRKGVGTWRDCADKFHEIYNNICSD